MLTLYGTQGSGSASTEADAPGVSSTAACMGTSLPANLGIAHAKARRGRVTSQRPPDARITGGYVSIL